MRKLVWLFLMIMSSYGIAVAQERVVTGKVTDESGNALPNVSVTVSGTSNGTSTKADGTFSVQIAGENISLVFSSIDKATQTVKVGASNVLNIVMLAKTDNLDEVVVVAYGTVKKGANVGASAQIGAKELAERPVTNAINAIVGSAPGIQATASSGAPGSAPTIRLRGFTSYSSDNSPLIVVDGAPFNGSLADINPDDIAAITTMKDGPSAALYGSRAANGVIAITTKTGTKAGGSLNVRVQKGITSKAVPDYDKVDAFEYYPLMWEAVANSMTIPADIAKQIASGTYGNRNADGLQVYNGKTYVDVFQALGGYNPFTGIANDAIVGVDGKLNPNATSLKYKDLNWYDAFYRNGNRDEVNLQSGGKSGKSDFMTSFNYVNENGFSMKSNQQRFSARVVANTQVTKWFKTGVNISAARSNGNNLSTNNGGYTNPFFFGRYIAPIYPVTVQDQNGNYILDGKGNPLYDAGKGDGSSSRPFSTGRHAIQELSLNDRKFSRELITSRLYADIYLAKGLTFTTTMNADVASNKTQVRENPSIGDGAPSGRTSQTWTKDFSYTFNQLLKYNKAFGEHNVDVMVGHENYSQDYNYIYGYKFGEIFTDGNPEFPNYSTITNLNSYLDKHRIESYLGRFNYDYDGKYFFSASVRRDGNSRFHKDYRWDNFYTLGASWRVDREEFMLNFEKISMLKLRASYGKTGNDQIGSLYAYQSLYTLGHNNQNYPGVLLETIGTKDLTWETLKQFNVAVEFGLFDNRLMGTVEYYNRQTDGLIFEVPVPYQNGGTTAGGFNILRNVGLMSNKGLEIELSGDIIRTKDWSWNLGFNASTLKNVMKKMPAETPRIQSGTKQLEVGRSIYDFYLRQWYGVDPTDGAPLYWADKTTGSDVRLIENAKGGFDTVTNSVSNAKFAYANKSSIPDLYGGIKSSVRYKNFTLNAIISYQLGGWIYDSEYAGLMHGGTYGTAFHKDMLNRWNTDGQVTNVPKLNNANTSNINAATSTRWLTKASYLQLSNVSLSYALDKNIINKIGAKTATVFLSGENLAYFSKRKGMVANETLSGTVNNGYPMARVVTVGLNVGF